MTTSEFDQGPAPSKSQRKRDMLALQAMGERLVDLSPQALATVPLTDGLRDAIALAQRINAREGRRRQLQYIGRLMRDVDAAPIEAALARIDAPGRADAALQHASERWRERLLGEPGAIDAWIDHVGDQAAGDRAELARLIAAAQAEHAQGQHARGYRTLFRRIRAALESGAPSEGA